MTIQNCVRAKYTRWAHEKCGNGCAYKTLWCCCYCTMFGTLNTAIGIPESWGVIFCCCELYPGEDPPEGLKDKFTGKDVKQEVIRQKSKKYKPCSKEHCGTGCGHTKDWILDEATCGLYGIFCDVKHGGLFNGPVFMDGLTQVAPAGSPPGDIEMIR